MHPRRGAVGLALAVLLAPSAGSAANGSKPRIPVTWSDAGPCATVVDLSSSTTLHLEYTVLAEDLGPLSDDEVADSRTHQFFAFRRLDYAAVGTAQRLPPWITQADIERAATTDPAVVPELIEAIDVLETTSRFMASDWLRITADDARVPISNAQAAMGVDWDVSTVAPGVYTVWGYTWEPLTNLWDPRPGFVKVIASASEADAAGPAIALRQDNAEVTEGEAYPVAGCADVPAGSTVTIEWGIVEGPVEPEWEPLIEDAPIESGELMLAITFPNDAVGDAPGQTRARLRATVTDPAGNTYVAYSPGQYELQEGEPPPDEGCRLAEPTRGSAWWLLLLLGVPRRAQGPTRSGAAAGPSTRIVCSRRTS